MSNESLEPKLQSVLEKFGEQGVFHMKKLKKVIFELVFSNFCGAIWEFSLKIFIKYDFGSKDIILQRNHAKKIFGNFSKFF